MTGLQAIALFVGIVAAIVGTTVRVLGHFRRSKSPKVEDNSQSQTATAGDGSQINQAGRDVIVQGAPQDLVTRDGDSVRRHAGFTATITDSFQTPGTSDPVMWASRPNEEDREPPEPVRVDMKRTPTGVELAYINCTSKPQRIRTVKLLIDGDLRTRDSRPRSFGDINLKPYDSKLVSYTIDEGKRKLTVFVEIVGRSDPLRSDFSIIVPNHE